jgi:sterol desaturase/sphingolipid hydroxylase (fatty acid hydroxylase superfamily)
MPTPLQVLLDPVSLTVLALYGALIVLEALFPARPLPAIRGWKLRASLVFVTYFFLSSYLPLFWNDSLARFRLLDLEALNPWAGALVGVLAYQLLVYVWHRTMHRVHWIWRAFHQMHHSAERVDIFGAFYFSPLDTLGFTFLGSIALTVVGLGAEAVTYFMYGSTLLAAIQHLNVRTPQWLGYIVQRPESHSVHHGRGVHQYNYADLPLFDILFGTFRNPAEFVPQSGFYDGASAKIPQILLFRDIAGADFDPAMKLGGN